jgi:D-alanyl-lipoteichoic acid acyltransferase DltB (MBOAT superfamily)
MTFNSLTFLVFFAIVLAIHHLPISARARKLNLVAFSYLFYAAWNPPFVALLWLSTTVDWVVSGRMGRNPSPAKRKALLIVSLSTNLGLLATFKYGDFLLSNFSQLLSSFGIAYQPPAMNIILPVGISFYTFQTLSYTIEVYRGRLKPWPSLLDFALFVSFFPQLVAGPIVRATDFLPQCIEPRRATRNQLSWGLTMLTIGVAQKVVLADTLLAPVVDKVYDASASAGSLIAWIATFAFSAQIFFDFAGYSSCAIGIALCLGFTLPANFRSPYAAVGFSDFWRRWHISLSSWLRDYLYISLGGNRKGLKRTQVNLVITMLLGGLWHGASWNFVVWGGLHGGYLLIERVAQVIVGGARWTQLWVVRFAAGTLTYLLVCIAWVFFRAQSFSDAANILHALFHYVPNAIPIPGRELLLAAPTIIMMLVTHLLLRNTTFDQVWARVPWWIQSIFLSILLMSVALVPGADRAFIYFQF